MVTADLLSRARAGDGEAFRELTGPHRRELQVHCYRMLGSFADAEDAVQETMLAAWQGIGGFTEERASLRTWLYKIATNRCLNARRAARRRPAREWDMSQFEPPVPTPRDEPVWLQPFPDALLEGAAGVPPGPEARYEREAACMCYTSGTTGRPKGVVYSHRAIVLHSLASAMTDGLAIGQREVLCPVVPMFHVNAWGLPFTATMVGCKQVLPGPHLDPESLLDLYVREGVTVSAGVPTIWMGILQALETEPDRWQLSGLRMVVGGSAAPESMIRGFDRHGLRVIHAWGMTEMTPLGTVSWLKRSIGELPEDQRYVYRAKQGLPVPLVETRIMGQTGEAPWDGQAMGELEVRGSWVASGYYQAPELTGKWSDDGWFRTGDVATIDPEGYVKITDRTKDLVKSGGEWISTVDLENALMGHPAVAEAAVIAAKHPKWDERPVAVVVVKEGATVTAGELRAFLEPKFAKFWLPDEFVFAKEVPRTAAGKFLKSALRQQYGGLLIDQPRPEGY